MPSAYDNAIKLGEYVFLRLHQLGIRSIFGVPGDYNLRLLDFVEPAGLHWVGNCNELNAAYAADGYARIKGVGALVTTFGVGELSAINGIAGAYAEKAPIIHLVGTPSRELQDARISVHHTFADGEYRRFAAAHANVTIAQSNLTDAITAPDEVDRIMEQALHHQRPVYLEIPDDMVDAEVSAANLHRRPKLGLLPPPETENELAKIGLVLERLYTAKQPVILVDGESRGLNILAEIDALIKTTSWPTWTTIFGKGLIDERQVNVHGTYRDKHGPEKASAYIKSSDLILHFGPHISDTNSHGFTTVPNDAVTIAFSQSTVRIRGVIHRNLPTQRFLSTLLSSLDTNRLTRVEGPKKHVRSQMQLESSSPLVQQHFWGVVNSIIRPGDIVLAETGTAAYGSRTFELPSNTRLLTAVTWLSIGYMLPAALGAGIAQRELLQSGESNGAEKSTRERVILFIGDGSLQMTVQELSTIIKERLNITIFVLNNNGYTIERVIHGRKQSYNDIANWNHQWALRLFGLDDETAAQNYFRARTWGELETTLKSRQVQDGDGVVLAEVYLGQEDCIDGLRDLLHKQVSKETKL
ncbi:thiamine diphosphate-binding protein [Mariannaea sp. PMI_226]|nr:thiamine diphosphate-binding protein [Mariannaea sp. PMI_226]